MKKIDLLATAIVLLLLTLAFSKKKTDSYTHVPTSRKCKECGKEFSFRNARVYCSQACNRKGYNKNKKTVEDICLYCGGKNTRTPYEVAAGTHRYCSRPCAQKQRNEWNTQLDRIKIDQN